jgi:calcium-dependent protein kinase
LVDKQEREELAKMFRGFDKNNDGRLDLDELKEGYERMNKIVSDDELDKIFSQIDVDGSGFIDYTEFIAASMDMKKANSDSHLECAFKKFDADGSGKISPKEVKDILGLST